MKSWEIDDVGNINIGEITEKGGWIIKSLASYDGENIYELYEIPCPVGLPKLIDTFYGDKLALEAAIEKGRTLL